MIMKFRFFALVFTFWTPNCRPGKNGQIGKLLAGKFFDLEGNLSILDEEIHTKCWEILLEGNLAHFAGKLTFFAGLPNPRPYMLYSGREKNKILLLDALKVFRHL